MPRLIPKITTPVHAIRLKQDLIIERGNWLLVLEDDSVLTMTDTEVRAAFRFVSEKLAPGPTPSPAPASVLRPPHIVTVQPKSFSTSIHGKTLRIGAQGVRVLSALAEKIQNGTTAALSRDLLPLLTVPADRNQITARLSEASKLGLVIMQGDTQPYHWTITNNGREIVRLLGEQAQQYSTRSLGA